MPVNGTYQRDKTFALVIRQYSYPASDQQYSYIYTFYTMVRPLYALCMILKFKDRYYGHHANFRSVIVTVVLAIFLFFQFNNKVSSPYIT